MLSEKIKRVVILLKTLDILKRMLLLLRQGKISKWFGIGQEAISVGTTYALKENDYVLPMHRNLVFLLQEK